MQTDYNTISSFLRWLYPEGPWTLTAISRSKKEILSQTFTKLESALEWIRERDQFNLYYSVNQPVPSSSGRKKFSKTDIGTVHYLHVDVDPRGDASIEEEQVRIKHQLESYKIKPSVIVFSGGGYNALWRLEEPISLTAPTPEAHIGNAVEVERRNWQFELDFNTPDHCRDISRILRLPGTINRPSDEKIKKGRVPTLAYVHSMNDESYSFSMFFATPLPPSQSQSSSAGKVLMDVKRITHIDELEGVSDKTKSIIVQGYDPDSKDAEKSRSEWLYRVCCDLVRANIDDPTIMGVITDSNFAISASVLDKGSRSIQYAVRQITRARDHADHPRLAEMNDKFAVIENYGGRCVVMREEPVVDEDGGIRTNYVFQAPREFFAARESSHISIKDHKGRDVVMNDGKWWFKHARRRQYSCIAFDPGKNPPPGALNTYTGLGVQPIQGENHHKYLEHVRDVICSGNEEHYNYLIRWIARIVQNPKTQCEVALVLISYSRGTGKSMFCDPLLKIFGDHGKSVTTMDQLLGRFNAHLSSKILVVAEEAYHAYDKRNESALKELITGKHRAVEYKGYDITWQNNYIHLIMTSNNEKVIPAGDYERRFFVLNVSEKRIGDFKYFSALDESMKNGGTENLLYELLNMDLSDFNVRSVPKTEALVRQQISSMNHDLEWLMDKLHTGVWIEDDPSLPWVGPIKKRSLYDDYIGWFRKRNHPFPKTHYVWHQWLKGEVQFETRQLSEAHATMESARPQAFIFPPLEDCRQRFAKNRNFPASFVWGEKVNDLDVIITEEVF